MKSIVRRDTEESNTEYRPDCCWPLIYVCRLRQVFHREAANFIFNGVAEDLSLMHNPSEHHPSGTSLRIEKAGGN